MDGQPTFWEILQGRALIYMQLREMFKAVQAPSWQLTSWKQSEGWTPQNLQVFKMTSSDDAVTMMHQSHRDVNLQQSSISRTSSDTKHVKSLCKQDRFEMFSIFNLERAVSCLNLVRNCSLHCSKFNSRRDRRLRNEAVSCGHSEMESFTREVSRQGKAPTNFGQLRNTSS